MIPIELVVLVLVVLSVTTLAGTWSVAALTLPFWHLSRGRFHEARAAARRVEESWLRVFEGARDGATYVRALAFHLEGRLDEALEALATARESKGLRSTLLVLEGGTLTLAGREPDRAATLLEEGCRGQALPEDLLFLAHARHAQGRIEEAEALFARAGARRPPNAGWRSINEAVFHSLRGLYLIRSGRADEAAQDLELAASSPVTTVYVERARALLPGPGDAEPDPRSSLAPQVMNED